MREIKVQYKVKTPKNEKEKGLRITNIVGGCDECGTEMQWVGSTNCVHHDFTSVLYQCPKCKTIELLDYPFGHNTQGIDEPDSKWERVSP